VSGPTEPRFLSLEADDGYISEIGIQGSIARRFRYSLRAL
jgi:hypothetical protein